MGDSVRCYTKLHEQNPMAVDGERLDAERVAVELWGTPYIIEYSAKAEPHTKLVVFDGLLVPHGLAGGTKELRYRRSRDPVFAARGDGIVIIASVGNVRPPESYAAVFPPAAPDYWRDPGCSDPGARFARLCRLFFAIPANARGVHSIVYTLKPRSLERKYVMIVAKRTGVDFITCNTY